jgi:hypothetical protein
MADELDGGQCWRPGGVRRCWAGDGGKCFNNGEDDGLTRRGTIGGRAQEHASIDRSDAAVRVLMMATLRRRLMKYRTSWACSVERGAGEVRGAASRRHNMGRYRVIPIVRTHDTVAHRRRVIDATVAGVAMRSIQALQQASTMAS